MFASVLIEGLGVDTSDNYGLDDLSEGPGSRKPSPAPSIESVSSVSTLSDYPHLTMPRHTQNNRVYSTPSPSPSPSPSPRLQCLPLQLQFHGKFEQGLAGTHRWLRWPLLVIILILVLVELLLYVLLRFLVALWEMAISFICTRHAQQLKKLSNAKSFQEWNTIATKLDSFEGNDFWKTVNRSPYYDWKNVEKLLQQFEECSLRHYDDDSESDGADIQVLLPLLSRVFNFNAVALGLDNKLLFSESYCGTKLLLHTFIDKVPSWSPPFDHFHHRHRHHSLLLLVQVVELLVRVRDTPSLSRAEKLSFLSRSRRSFGRTALCLSSGAAMAYYHFGVVKALIEQGLLPDIISGR